LKKWLGRERIRMSFKEHEEKILHETRLTSSQAKLARASYHLLFLSAKPLKSKKNWASWVVSPLNPVFN
jgi:hypothetical protein